jgi:hypothetical protein
VRAAWLEISSLAGLLADFDTGSLNEAVSDLPVFEQRQKRGDR